MRGTEKERTQAASAKDFSVKMVRGRLPQLENQEGNKPPGQRMERTQREGPS